MKRATNIGVRTRRTLAGLLVSIPSDRESTTPFGCIDLPGMLNDGFRIDVYWPAGSAATVDKARAFFRAGLEVCRQLEKAGRKAGVIPPSLLSPRGDK
jgi:hypothetical protein